MLSLVVVWGVGEEMDVRGVGFLWLAMWWAEMYVGGETTSTDPLLAPK